MKFIVLFSITATLIAIIFDELKNMFSSTVNPVEENNFLRGFPLRGCDVHGCGYFGAPRMGRIHKGLDLKFNPFDIINAPFDCYVNRIGNPYSTDLRYQLVELIGVNKFKGYKVKLMYVVSLHQPNPQKVIKQGQPIATVQNISEKYSSKMVNHVHFEMYNEYGQLINPEQYA